MAISNELKGQFLGACAELEQGLRSYGATGCGLKELIESSCFLSSEDKTMLYKIMRVRNKIAHETNIVYSEKEVSSLLFKLKNFIKMLPEKYQEYQKKDIPSYGCTPPKTPSSHKRKRSVAYYLFYYWLFDHLFEDLFEDLEADGLAVFWAHIVAVFVFVIAILMANLAGSENAFSGALILAIIAYIVVGVTIILDGCCFLKNALGRAFRVLVMSTFFSYLCLIGIYFFLRMIFF